MSARNVFSATLVLVLLATLSAVFASVNIGHSNTVTLTTGLVGYWPLDGNTTNWTTNTTRDLSSSGNTGTLVNMSTTSSPTTGKVGGALKFSGPSSQVVTIATGTNIPTGNSNYTIAVWYNASSLGGTNGLVGWGLFGTNNKVNALRLATNGECSGGKGFVNYWWGVGNDLTACSSSVALNVWQQVVVTFNGTTRRMYLNATQIASDTPTGHNVPDTSNFKIGQTCPLNTCPTNGGEFFSGSLDDVRIYNRALSSQEVAQLYALGTANVAHSNAVTLSTGLVGYWPLDGNTTNWTTNTTRDLSSNGNIGTMGNMFASTSPVAGRIGSALKFDGSSSYIGLGAAPPGIPYRPPVTTCAWVKPSGTNGKIVARNGWFFNWMLYLSSGVPAFQSMYTSGTNYGSATAAALSVGQWYHLCGTMDASNNIVLYRNGVANAGGFSFSSGSTGQNGVSVGAGIDDHGVNPANFFPGTIDDVRIYNRALSAQEVAQLYALGAANVAHSNTVTLSTGLVGYWPLDGNTTNWTTNTTRDLSGRGNTGTFVSMSTSSSPAAGKIGGALKFDGNSSYVNASNASSLNITGSVTLSAWVYLNAGFSSGYEAIVGKWQDVGVRSYLLSFGSSGVSRANVVFWLDDGFGHTTGLNGATAQSAFVGGWHHIVGVYNQSAATQSIYVDGKLDASGSFAGTSLLSNSLNVEIGNHTSNTAFFNGKLDDVRIYNRALSAQEVAQLYSLGR